MSLRARLLSVVAPLTILLLLPVVSAGCSCGSATPGFTFVDTDGDLLADPPTKSSNLVDPDVLTFCYAPGNDGRAAQKAIWQDFLDHMADVTGRRVRYVGIQRPAPMRESMRTGSLHVGAFNTGAVPSAVEEAGFHPRFVMASVNENGEASYGYRMFVIVRDDSEITEMSQIRDKVFAITHEGSNSGYKAPTVILEREFGITIDPQDPANSDVVVRKSTAHDRSILGVAAGSYDVAAVASDIYEQMMTAGVVDPESLRVIYRSELEFPTTAFGYAYNLTSPLKEQIREAFRTFNGGSLRGTELGRHFSEEDRTIDRFYPITYKEDWAIVREIRNRFER